MRIKVSAAHAKKMGLRYTGQIPRPANLPTRHAAGQYEWIELPFPPTANHLHTVARGRKILSKAGRAYYDAAALAIGPDCGRFSGPVEIEIWAVPPDKRRRDLSNLLKASEDALVKAGVLADDSLIVKETIQWDIKNPLGDLPRLMVQIQRREV